MKRQLQFLALSALLVMYWHRAPVIGAASFPHQQPPGSTTVTGTIRAYYDAINLHQYTRAYGLLAPPGGRHSPGLLPATGALSTSGSPGNPVHMVESALPRIRRLRMASPIHV